MDLIERLQSEARSVGEADGALLQEAAALLTLVKQARLEGWYEDNPGWEPIDKALGL